MSDPSCRSSYRELLGVYVIGAIDPAERAVMETHLNQCHDCREELAGLAALPALLRRVSVAEAERIVDPAHDGHADEPSPEVLSSVLGRVRARQRTGRLRSAFAIAASVIIAAGGGVAVSETLLQSSTHVAQGLGPQLADVASASHGGVSSTVHYGKWKIWDVTSMSVQVKGIPPWTNCKFWVITKDGHTVRAGGWLEIPGSYQPGYPAMAPVPVGDISSFVITAGHRTLLRIPAPT